MSIDFCLDCDEIIEGNVITAECPDCGEEFFLCGHCHGPNVICLPEDDR